MQIVNLAVLNLRCAWGFMRSATNCDLLTTARAFMGVSHHVEEKYPTVIVTVTAIPLVNLLSNNLYIPEVLRSNSLLTALNKQFVSMNDD